MVSVRTRPLPLHHLNAHLLAPVESSFPQPELSRAEAVPAMASYLQRWQDGSLSCPQPYGAHQITDGHLYISLPIAPHLNAGTSNSSDAAVAQRMSWDGRAQSYYSDGLALLPAADPPIPTSTSAKAERL